MEEWTGVLGFFDVQKKKNRFSSFFVLVFELRSGRGREGEV